MAAANTDKVRKGEYKFSTTLKTTVNDSITSVELNSVTGLPTDTAIDIIIDRVDSSGNETPSAAETITGLVPGSGTTLTDCVRGVEGSAQEHTAGAVVEVLFTAAQWNDLCSNILTDHNQDGSHKQIKGLDNNSAITQEDSGATDRDIAKITSGDILNIGNTTTPLQLINYPGWNLISQTATRTGNHVFTLPFDATDIIGKGTRIKYKESGGSAEYGVVISASYSSPDTTITLATNTDYTMAGNPSDGLWYSNEASPIGYPDWFAFTPTGNFITIGNGTITGEFKLAGQLCTTRYKFTLGSTSAVATGAGFNPPIPCHADMDTYFTGECIMKDANGSTYIGTICIDTTTRFRWAAMNSGGTYTVRALATNTIPFTWATSDICLAWITYKIA